MNIHYNNDLPSETSNARAPVCGCYRMTEESARACNIGHMLPICQSQRLFQCHKLMLWLRAYLCYLEKLSCRTNTNIRARFRNRYPNDRCIELMPQYYSQH